MAARRKAPGNKALSQPASLPSPIGGWNSRDALGAMPATDAVSMVNYWPSMTDVSLRHGFTRWADGFTGQAETLFAYSGSTTNKLFVGAATSKIYEVTSTGTVGAAAVTALTNVRWQYTNIATPGGNYIVAVNGADTPLSYDGTTWATTAITVVTSTKLITVVEHKNRLWFCEVGTLKAWYLPIQSIAGAAAALDLSSFCPHGGYLMAAATWTIDAGYGVDDLLVFVTSNGDVLVYRGTDPSSASTWALVGAFYAGSPVGRRCFEKYKGDLVLIVQDGVVPLSTYLQSSRVDPRSAFSSKIQFAMSAAISSYSSNFGWDIKLFARENMLLINIPVTAGNGQQQYVMNTIQRGDGEYAWANFMGWNANCFEIFGDNLYFGGNGFVAKAWSTIADSGSAIQGNVLQAFNYFKTPGELKRFTMMRPTIITDGTPSLLGVINVDFDTSDPTGSLTVATNAAGVWDSGVWGTSLWGASQVSRAWQGTTGIGYCGAVHFMSNTAGINISWVATDIVIEKGAIL